MCKLKYKMDVGSNLSLQNIGPYGHMDMVPFIVNKLSLIGLGVFFYPLLCLPPGQAAIPNVRGASCVRNQTSLFAGKSEPIGFETRVI
ncbi:hypothetical protein AHAS_Ahas01G0032500 [Arachis hypogaea]